MPRFVETYPQARRRELRERDARLDAIAAARATEEAEAAAPTALPAPGTSLQPMSAVADNNVQDEQEHAVVMTSKEIRKAEKRARKEKRREKREAKEKKRKRSQEAGPSRYVPRSYLS